MIAANLPDVDVLVFATDIPSVAFRRGWTHGVLAQALLPVVLAAVMMAVGTRKGARFGPLLLLSYVGVLSHVLLDLLNNYGVRVLMPFSGRWFYGDSVFIVDVWLWLTLGVGVWWGYARGSMRPPRVSLVIATMYILAMVLSARAARSIVAETWRATTGSEAASLMVGPVPITPFRRTVIVDAGEHYVTGTFAFPRHVAFDPVPIPKRSTHPAVQRATARDRQVRAVLIWARFPYFQVEPSEDGTLVTVRDVRFGNRVGGVTTRVRGD